MQDHAQMVPRRFIVRVQFSSLAKAVFRLVHLAGMEVDRAAIGPGVAIIRSECNQLIDGLLGSMPFAVCKQLVDFSQQPVQFTRYH